MSASMLRDCHVKAFHMKLYLLQIEGCAQLVSKSLGSLTAVHPMLRAVHTPPLFQIISTHSCLELDVMDPLDGLQFVQAASAVYSAVSRLASHTSEQEATENALLRDLMQSLLDLPIDVSMTTLRARVLNANDRACLMLSIHHVVLDGPSQQIVHTGVRVCGVHSALCVLFGRCVCVCATCHWMVCTRMIVSGAVCKTLCAL